MPLNKDLFISRCIAQGISLTNAEKAWNKVISIEKHIQANTKLYSDMQHYSREERLKLREAAAEVGYEFTPNEVDDAIRAIGIIQKNVEPECEN